MGVKAVCFHLQSLHHTCFQTEVRCLTRTRGDPAGFQVAQRAGGDTVLWNDHICLIAGSLPVEAQMYRCSCRQGVFP